MACPHKFQDYITLERLDFEPTTLIVGTFNPSWPAGNPAQWFYGRTHDGHGNQNNNFWDVLPRLYGEESLINSTHQDWKAFCRRHKIAITDLISCINDANEANPDHEDLLKSYSDKAIADKFEQQVYVNIAQLLQQHPTIQRVYLTRGTGETFWRRLWRPVKQYATENGKRERTLLTPSGFAFYQHRRYNNQNPNHQIPHLQDFIVMKWQQQWHF